jgi:hypothetical protein
VKDSNRYGPAARMLFFMSLSHDVGSGPASAPVWVKFSFYHSRISARIDVIKRDFLRFRSRALPKEALKAPGGEPGDTYEKAVARLAEEGTGADHTTHEVLADWTIVGYGTNFTDVDRSGRATRVKRGSFGRSRIATLSAFK